MHAGRESEWVGVENRIVWVEAVIYVARHGIAAVLAVGRLQRLWRCVLILLPVELLWCHLPGPLGRELRRGLWLLHVRWELLRVRCGGGGVFAGVSVVDHVGLRIVFLFCMHGGQSRTNRALCLQARIRERDNLPSWSMWLWNGDG